MLDQLKMRLPVVKDIYTQIYLSLTLSVLGLSLANGVPITVALNASKGVVNNSIFVKFLVLYSQSCERRAWHRERIYKFPHRAADGAANGFHWRADRQPWVPDDARGRFL